MTAQPAIALNLQPKPTRREVLLAQMDQVVPWSQLCARIALFYPKVRQGGGRPPVEEALYEVPAMRRFVGSDLVREAAPDETTVCKFRHLLEKHELAEQLFAAINAHLSEHGLRLSAGTLVDATIIAAAASTKNKARSRDAQMHQTRKGNQWYFGMKAHIGVDAGTGLVHSVVSTAANVAEVTQTAHLLHGTEQHVFADAGYIRAETSAPAEGRTFRIADKRSKAKAIKHLGLRALTEELELAKASIRAAVEHPFRVLKRQFGDVKVRDTGLAKNASQVTTLFALVDLWMARSRLLAMA